MASYSGFWNGLYGAPYAPLGSNNTKEFNHGDIVMLNRVISRTRGGRVLGAVIKALNGAAVGGTATATHKRIASDVDPDNPIINGGVRTIETKTDINRATTSTDEALVDTIVDLKFAPTSYPTDASGNGGADKRNRF